MAFCASCGTQVPDDVKFCPTCGKPIEAAAAPQAPYPPQPPQPYAPQPQQPYGQPAPGYYADPAMADAQQNKMMAIFAYILFFIPLITGDHKKSPFVKYHTNQGIILWIFGIAYGVLDAIIAAIFSAILVTTWRGWGAYGIITTILGLLWIIPGILMILGIVNAVQGKMKPLPVIGKFTILK